MDRNDNKDFISEKVKKNKRDLKKMLRDGAFFCVEAMAFGIIAAVAFSWMKPRIDKLIGYSPEEIVTVNKYKDDAKETTDEDRNEEQQEQNSEVIKLNEVRGAIVLVESRSDIIGENEEKIGEEFDYSSGAVISTGDTTLILTDYDTIKNSDMIMVTFENNAQCGARVTSIDRQLGIAVIGADTKDLFVDGYTPNMNIFGEALNISNGEELLYVGVSEGVGKINLKCEVITTDNMIQYTDCMYSMFTTDMASNVARNGFVFNDNNQLVGMIARPENNGIANLVAALNISDIKPVIDKLSGGNSLPFMGINGTTVTEQLKENVNSDMPYGVYVTSVETNSPAYRVGILNGDIITSVAGNDIDTFKSFSNTINRLSTGNSVEVNVSRQGKNGYKKLKFNVIIGGKEF